MITIFNKQTDQGQMWFKKPNGEKYPCEEALKDFGIKYQSIDFDFSDQILINSFINFEIYKNILLIQTNDGFCIDNFILNENGFPTPETNYNNFIKIGIYKKIDYWIDENTSKIYTFYLELIGSNILNFKVFEFKSEKNIEIYNENIIINDILFIKIDPIKVCYNNETNFFNISTICYDNSLKMIFLSIFIDKSGKNVSVNKIG